MSVFTDVAAEGILLGGGGCAILLQIANPAVGAGVAHHSDFANRPLERLANTVTYVYAAAFGTDEERREVVARVNRAHGPVHSARASVHSRSHPQPHPHPHPSAIASVPPGEVRYDAFDAEAQLWVAATLYQTALAVYEKVFGPLSAADAEDVYLRYGVLGTSLQVPADAWPRDLAAFRVYWATALAELHVTDDARRVAHDLLHPHTAPVWLRMAMPLVRLLTTGLLPSELRRAFVLPWSGSQQRRFDRVFAVAVRVYPHLPLGLRHLPRDRYMSTLKASLGRQGPH